LKTELLEIDTTGRSSIDLTSEVRGFTRGLGDGLVHVFAPHATAGVALIETGSGTEPDLQDALERLLPVEDIYAHRHGSLGHGRDHVVPAFISPSLVVPVIDGQPVLGTWQSIVLVDTNSDNPHRNVRLSFIPA
jgi:secondary thiamine-phosphate synthase enzyme